MPTVTERYVELAGRVAHRLGAPRVRAFHLPPASGTKEAEFCALELDEGSIGFAYIQLAGTESPLRERHGGRGLAGIDAASLAAGFATHDPVARALGFAAINALSQGLFTRARWVPDAGVDPLGGNASTTSADSNGPVFVPVIDISGKKYLPVYLKQSTDVPHQVKSLFEGKQTNQ